VISEAIVAGTPVIASRIAGNVGLLGEDYPGYFGVGDTCELARLILRAEIDAEFLIDLKTRCEKNAALFDPAHEKKTWGNLLKELNPVEK
jgi:glycosyltransferase involved in cell wall biosynthesis